MVKKIAIIGSRDYPTFNGEHPVVRLIKALPAGTVVVTGGAAGVDRLAESIAKMYGFAVQVYTPEAVIAANPDMPFGAACVLRDKKIVDASDRVYAFWNGTSRGTVHGIRHAIRTGKFLTVVGTNGVRMTDADVQTRLDQIEAKGTPTRRQTVPTPVPPPSGNPAPPSPPEPAESGSHNCSKHSSDAGRSRAVATLAALPGFKKRKHINIPSLFGGDA